MGLIQWGKEDAYDHEQLALNIAKLDMHDHTLARGTQIPTEGIAPEAITSELLSKEVPLVPSGAILPFGGTEAPTGFLICNGAQYKKSLYPKLYEAIGNRYGESGEFFNVPPAGKERVLAGTTNIATEQNRENAAYGLLGTPDEVEVVLPENCLIIVGFQATWKSTVATSSSAAIFIGSNQLKISEVTGGPPSVQSASLLGPEAHWESLTSYTGGLVSAEAKAGNSEYTADVTTGQVIGIGSNSFTSVVPVSGMCSIFAAAGTYKVSIQYKASSGKVIVKNRKLWVETHINSNHIIRT